MTTNPRLQIRNWRRPSSYQRRYSSRPEGPRIHGIPGRAGYFSHNETTRFAHLILPAASFAEKDGTFTNGARRIQRVRKAIEPLSGLAEWQVICELSTRMGYPISYHHPLYIMDEITSLTPIYGGIQWFDPTKDSTLYQELFSRPGGKARFVPSEFRGPGEVLLIQTKHLAHVE